jgi:hypothetical protein
MRKSTAREWGEKVMEEGSSIHVPACIRHRFTGLKDSLIVEISTQHFEDDSYRDTESEQIPDREWISMLLKYTDAKIVF